MNDRKRVVKLAKQFREVLEVAEELEAIGDLEQATRSAEQTMVEAKGKASAALSDLGVIQAKLIVAEKDLRLVRELAVRARAETEDKTVETLAKADLKADAIIQSAVDAERVVSELIIKDQEQHKIVMDGYARDEIAAQATIETVEKELAALRKRIG